MQRRRSVGLQSGNGRRFILAVCKFEHLVGETYCSSLDTHTHTSSFSAAQETFCLFGKKRRSVAAVSVNSFASAPAMCAKSSIPFRTDESGATMLL